MFCITCKIFRPLHLMAAGDFLFSQFESVCKHGLDQPTEGDPKAPAAA